MSRQTAHVIDAYGHALTGDSRGIIVPYEQRHEVSSWAFRNNIEIEYHGSLDSKDLWYVKDKNDWVWFSLRWANC